jgi:hypothetical protein
MPNDDDFTTELIYVRWNSTSQRWQAWFGDMEPIGCGVTPQFAVEDLVNQTHDAGYRVWGVDNGR